MWAKDYGYAARLSWIGRAVGVAVLLHALVVFGIGIASFGIAYDGALRRLETWFYWRWCTQCIGVFALLAMYWLRHFNWANWRYWVQMIVCGVCAGWHAVFIGYAIRDWIDCTVYTNCIGQSPLGIPWLDSDNPDPLFITMFVLVATSMVWCAGYVLLGFYLRNRINMRLALAHAASRKAIDPNAQLLSGGMYGAPPGGGMTGGGGAAFVMFELQDALPPAPMLISGEYGEPTQSYYIMSTLDDEATYVSPDQVDMVRLMIAHGGDRNLQLVAGPHVNSLDFSLFTPHVPVLFQRAITGIN